MPKTSASSVASDALLSIRIEARNPFRYLSLPLLSRLQQAAAQPRRRLAKRLIGKPVRAFFRFAHRTGLGGLGVFALDVAGEKHRFKFNARNTQFTPTRNQAYEPELAALLDLLVGEHDTFFDIGANWGYFSLYVLSRPGFAGTVHAFEAYPPTFTDLNSIARQSPFGERLVCHPVALGNHNGIASMGLIDGLQSGTARLDGSGGLMSTEAKRLDDMGLQPPSVIKIDVEGHEANVFRGAARILSSARPIVIFENWREPSRPATTLEPIAVLEEHDYRFFVPVWIHDEDGLRHAVVATNTTPTDRFGLVEIGWQHRFLLTSQVNILAYPAERMAELHRLFEA
jgi:FkbM family methyltransferase